MSRSMTRLSCKSLADALPEPMICKSASAPCGVVARASAMGCCRDAGADTSARLNASPDISEPCGPSCWAIAARKADGSAPLTTTAARAAAARDWSSTWSNTRDVAAASERTAIDLFESASTRSTGPASGVSCICLATLRNSKSSLSGSAGASSDSESAAAASDAPHLPSSLSCESFRPRRVQPASSDSNTRAWPTRSIAPRD